MAKKHQQSIKPSLKKKIYVEVPKVAEFFTGQSLEVRAEYWTIVSHLERDGRLFAPEGEKVRAGLFAIRIIKAANVRVFYIEIGTDRLLGIHAYVKKSRGIPKHELDLAQKIARQF